MTRSGGRQHACRDDSLLPHPAGAQGEAGSGAAAGESFGPGIVMSSRVTLPKDSRGRSCPLEGPTTRMVIWSLWTYFFATRATSAVVTFSIFCRYRAR